MAIWGTTIALHHWSRSNVVVRPGPTITAACSNFCDDLSGGTGDSGNTPPCDTREAQGFNVACHEIYREFSIPRKLLFSDTLIN
jgi:hypothetical protein